MKSVSFVKLSPLAQQPAVGICRVVKEIRDKLKIVDENGNELIVIKAHTFKDQDCAAKKREHERQAMKQIASARA
jgi:hypothetical protein